MPIGEPEKRRERLRVTLMLLALVGAAFLGAALGLVWQSSGLGMTDEEKAAAALAEAAEEEAAAIEEAQGDADAQEADDEDDDAPPPPTSA